MVSNKTKKQEDSELISLIEEIENEKTEIKVINPISTIKEIKDSNKETLIKKIKEKPLFKQNNFDYLHIIQKLVEEESFYVQSPNFDYNDYKLKFDYDDYKLNNEEIVQFTQFYKGLNTQPEEIKYYDSPILDNHKVDDIMDKFKFAQMKGLVLGDYIFPENVKPEDFNIFCLIRKLNPALMVLKYALNPL